MKDMIGKDTILGIGHWTEQSPRRDFPSVGVSKWPRLFGQHFTVVIVPEFFTSSICAKCDGKLEGISRDNKEIRGICKCNKCNITWDRDLVAVINIRWNLQHKLHGWIVSR